MKKHQYIRIAGEKAGYEKYSCIFCERSTALPEIVLKNLNSRLAECPNSKESGSFIEFIFGAYNCILS